MLSKTSSNCYFQALLQGLQRALRWIGVALLSAVLTMVLTAAGTALAAISSFKPSDESAADISSDINITISFERQIAIKDRSPGPVELVPDNATGKVTAIKEYCVRSNYTDAKGGLKITGTNIDSNQFNLVSNSGAKLPLEVQMEDVKGGKNPIKVIPGKAMDIDVDAYDSNCESSTTLIHIGGDFNNIPSKSGLYKTTLKLTFYAK